MGTARKRWTPEEKAAIMQLHREGHSYKDIASKLRPGVKNAWRTIGDIVRESRKHAVEKSAQKEVAAQHPPSLPSRATVSRITLPPAMATSLTAREFMNIMDDDQRQIFIATYESLRGDADEDSLTRAENEMLIRAAFANVKYLRAQALLNTAESYIMLEMDGGLGDTPEDKAKKRFAGRCDVYKKDADQWHKEYMELIEGLKLTRKQRLDKVKDTRNTFLDLQLELSNKVRQESILEDIKRLNDLTDKELRRLAEGEVDAEGRRFPWLIGAFDHYVKTSEETDNTDRHERESSP